MKKHLISLVVTIALATSLNAQLQVLTSGNVQCSKNVGIGTTPNNQIGLNLYKYITPTTLESYGLKSHLKSPSSMPIANFYAVNGHADLSTFSLSSPSSYMKRAIGVLGEVTLNANCTSNVLGIAVAGVVNSRITNGGVAIYGSTNPAYLFPSNPLGLYAGFFGGNVRVDGIVSANTYVTTSDCRFKSNIENVEKQTASLLYKLRPVSYYFKPDSVHMAYNENAQEIKNVHFGLIAQEVEEVYPNLVYKDEAGYMSINYIELIPLLIKEIQELSAEVEALKKEESVSIPRKNAHANNAVETSAILYQNNPNPFSIDTKIDYQLPESTQKATLYIYNMNGLQVDEYPISSFGIGSVIVSAGHLEAGMYLYSLIADGQVIDTKRMILTK